MFPSEVVVHCIDAWDNKLDCSQETKPREKIEEASLDGRESIAIPINGRKLCI